MRDWFISPLGNERQNRAGEVFHSALPVVLLLLCVAVTSANAGLLNGYYQITNILISEDGGQQRGFNNTDLYIHATDRRVTVAGAFRGIHIRRVAVIERVIRDTLVLRDTEDMASVYKFQIRNNTVTGRHSLSYDDGTRRVINSRAVIRQLNHGEIDRLSRILEF